MKYFLLILLPSLFIILIAGEVIYVPFATERYVSLYSRLTGVNGEVISMPNEVSFPSTGLASIIFSTNSKFAVGDLRTGIGLIHLEDKSLSILTKENGLLGVQTIFSPSGEKILYPVIRKDIDLTVINKEFNTPVYGYSDLYFYDVKTKNIELVSPEKKFLMFGSDQHPFYGWVSENKIVYSCTPKGNPYEYYSGDRLGIDSHKIEYCILNLNDRNITTQPEPLQITENKLSSLRHYGFSDGSFCGMNMCISANRRFRGYDTTLLGELWVTDGGKKKLIYRGNDRIDNIYFSSDKHIYGLFNERNENRQVLKKLY